LCRRAKIIFKGAPKGASPTAMAQAPPLKLIFHGKNRRLSRRTGKSRLAFERTLTTPTTASVDGFLARRQDLSLSIQIRQTTHIE
jgi:hypothetical protein